MDRCARRTRPLAGRPAGRARRHRTVDCPPRHSRACTRLGVRSGYCGGGGPCRPRPLSILRGRACGGPRSGRSPGRADADRRHGCGGKPALRRARGLGAAGIVRSRIHSARGHAGAGPLGRSCCGMGRVGDPLRAGLRPDARGRGGRSATRPGACRAQPSGRRMRSPSVSGPGHSTGQSSDSRHRQGWSWFSRRIRLGSASVATPVLAVDLPAPAFDVRYRLTRRESEVLGARGRRPFEQRDRRPSVHQPKDRGRPSRQREGEARRVVSRADGDPGARRGPRCRPGTCGS